MALVTLEQAKKKLRIVHDFEDVEIDEAITQARAVVFDWIKRPYDASTDDEDDVIRLAVLNMLRHIWDDAPTTSQRNHFASGELPDDVTCFLVRRRKPTLA